MKKLLLGIIISLMIVLSGCAAMEDIDDPHEPSSFSELIFNKAKSSYTANLESEDIFDGLQSFEKEFFIAYSIADMSSSNISPLDENMELAYRTFFQKLDTLKLHNKDIFKLTSGELKEVIEDKGGTATAQDIFVFNSVKETIDLMVAYSDTISRKQYISLYTDSDISNDAYEGITMIQDYVSDLQLYRGISIEIEDYSYEEFITLCETEISLELNESEALKVQEAFDILDILYEKGEAD